MVTEQIFWDVDTQVDFMHEDGKLYVPGAESIIPNLKRLREHARERGIRTVASADDHRLADPELSDAPDFRSTFPPHCLRGTPGQARIPETALDVDVLVFEPTPLGPEEVRRLVAGHDGDLLFHKNEFDVFTNPNVRPALEVIDPRRIVLFGVALDVCDRFAVEGILSSRPDVELSVVTDAVSAIDADAGAALLEDWRQRGVKLVTTDEVT